MTKVQYTNYGTPEVLRLVEVAKPTPGDHELLIKIYATTVTATECTFRKGEPKFTRIFTGLTKPKITSLGEELSGVVEAVGKHVQGFVVGDEVFGTAGPEFGANAEYLCVSKDGVVAPKPFNLSHSEAASSVDGFLTALPFLRDHGKITKGQKVLINGASGSVGSAAIQIAKYYGAEVTGVCSTRNLDLVKAIGADHVIDYQHVDFWKLDEKYDIIFDTHGNLSFSTCKHVLTADGIFLLAAIGLSGILNAIWSSLFGRKKAKIAATGLRKPKERKKDLELLKSLLETGIIKPVIDRLSPLEDIVSAHAYVDTGRKRGNVVITVS
ncbi:UNVERIFIED_CONTAM: hypothetical protein GTU68_066202 [Idotea baltica]|nr:hypothetical protein [Idotea baltica]